MVSITSEDGLYLYTGKVDMRKDIDGLSGIVSEELGHNTGSDTRPDANAPQDKAFSGDTVSAFRKKILRTHPGVEMKVERIDYSKAVAYIDSPIYHRLEDYYTLPEGACYVTRGGEIDKSCVKVILYNPATVEEHIY